MRAHLGLPLLGFGSISKDTTAFMVLPSPHIDLLAETPQVGLGSTGCVGESQDKRAQESWKLREDSSQEGASRDAAAVPLFLGV